MIETIRNWILCIIGTTIVCSVITALTPEGTAKRAVKVVCGFAAAIAMLGIITDFDYADYSSYLSLYRLEADETISDALQKSSQQTRFIIEEECEAYILDKANGLGGGLDTVSVTAAWSDEGVWYPARVELSGNMDSEAKEQLTGEIAAELGISQEEQIWSGENET